jgi:hypothetical protein
MIPLYTFDFQLYVNIFGFNLTTKQYTFSKADDITLHDGYAKTNSHSLLACINSWDIFSFQLYFGQK